MSAQLDGHLEQLLLDGTKVGWYPERVEAWKRGEKIAPITIDWALTRQCNYACEFCYAMLQENTRYEQTLKTSTDFLDDCAEIGVKGVSLISDGESTVHKDYIKVIQHGHRVGIMMGVGSNGLLLTRRVLEQILPALTYCRFNFSGGEKDRYADIMGAKPEWFDRVIQNIRDAMEIKHRLGLKVTVNMQMVTMPKHWDQIIPLVNLALDVRPDYIIFKHTADDSRHQLGIDYSQYDRAIEKFKEAEEIGKREGLKVVCKWSRMDGVRTYSKCYGPPFIMQVSGSGLVAPCGFLFNERYKAFHIGNIVEQRFRDIWASDRYWEVMRYLASDEFNPMQRCGPNCLQHNTNTFLFDHLHRGKEMPTAPAPADLGFI